MSHELDLENDVTSQVFSLRTGNDQGFGFLCQMGDPFTHFCCLLSLSYLACLSNLVDFSASDSHFILSLWYVCCNNTFWEHFSRNMCSSLSWIHSLVTESLPISAFPSLFLKLKLLVKNSSHPQLAVQQMYLQRTDLIGKSLESLMTKCHNKPALFEFAYSEHYHL